MVLNPVIEISTKDYRGVNSSINEIINLQAKGLAKAFILSWVLKVWEIKCDHDSVL